MKKGGGSAGVEGARPACGPLKARSEWNSVIEPTMKRLADPAKKMATRRSCARNEEESADDSDQAGDGVVKPNLAPGATSAWPMR